MPNILVSTYFDLNCCFWVTAKDSKTNYFVIKINYLILNQIIYKVKNKLVSQNVFLLTYEFLNNNSDLLTETILSL